MFSSLDRLHEGRMQLDCEEPQPSILVTVLPNLKWVHFQLIARIR